MRIFVTGASGFIGSAVVPELIGAGHQVVGLARSDASAAALAAAGAEVRRGTLDDLIGLREAAAASDGVIHLAFKHDIAFSGNFQGAADADLRAIETFGSALEGSDRPLVIASGVLGLASGRVATERDAPGPAAGPRAISAQTTLDLAARGVRSSVVRLAPTVHGEGDQGFMATLIGIAREKGVSGYVSDGENRWPAVHQLDAARLFRLALEQAPAGSVLHGVAEEGVPVREIAEVIGRHLGLPVVSVPADTDFALLRTIGNYTRCCSTPQNPHAFPTRIRSEKFVKCARTFRNPYEQASEHFGWLASFLAADSPASSALTQERLGWQPTHPGLLADLDQGHYF